MTISKAPVFQERMGKWHDGNMSRHYDDNTLFAIGESESFRGFSGTSEYDHFPLRQLFCYRHNQLPSEWDAGYISINDVKEFVDQNNKKVLSTHYNINGEIKRCLLFLGGTQNLYVLFYSRSSDPIENDKFGVALVFSKKNKAVESYIEYFRSRIIQKQETPDSTLNILIQTNYGFELEPKQICPPEIDLDINYNNDFVAINKVIVEKLSMNNSKGLVLLHGLPGTGKTTYIRYLISILKKKIIYIPPNLADSLSNPEMIRFFLGHTNSILIIEDAENVLGKRQNGSSQAISNILNITDGLLGDCVNIHIIATFNKDILSIDQALLRKGRLIAKYEFKELSQENIVKLAKKLNISPPKGKKLSDIYNSKEIDFTDKPQVIGF